MSCGPFYFTKCNSEISSMNRLAKFTTGEDGAVTIDWVLLTAGLVGFGTLVFVNFSGGIRHVDTQTGNALSGIEVQEIVFEYGD